MIELAIEVRTHVLIRLAGVVVSIALLAACREDRGGGATSHLTQYLSREGDAFGKLSALETAIRERIQRAGLSAWESAEEGLDAVSTWEERAVVRLMSLYSARSISGDFLQYVQYGLSLTRELEAVGAHSTVAALRELDRLDMSGRQDDAVVARIEAQVPGDFVWAEPILKFVIENADRFRGDA